MNTKQRQCVECYL